MMNRAVPVLDCFRELLYFTIAPRLSSMDSRAPQIRREGLTVLKEPQNATIESVQEIVAHGA